MRVNENPHYFIASLAILCYDFCMSSRKAIERMIEKAEEEKVHFAKQIELKDAYIQGLKDTLRHLPKDGQNGNGKTVLRPGSEIAKAREILLKEGKPLHITEILKRIGKDVNRKSRASLSGYMSYFMRRGEYFTRPAPNTFGLLEFDPPQPSSDEPPAEFGQE